MSAEDALYRAAERADERMKLIMDEDAEEQVIMASAAAVIFAGTDLPGPEALRVIANMVENAKKKIVDGAPAEAEMRGVAVATFFTGFFAREEVGRLRDPEDWPDALRRRAAAGEARFQAGEPVTQEDLVVCALVYPERFDLHVRSKED